MVKKEILNGLARSSAAKYAYAQRTFASFCSHLGAHPVPCTAGTLARYVVWLKHHKALGPDAIRGHVAAVRHLHTVNGHILRADGDPRVAMVKRGACKRTGPRDSRLPVTYRILARMVGKPPDWSDFDHRLFLAGAMVAYAGFFRISELCFAKGSKEFKGIRLEDVKPEGDMLCLTLRTSKTDRENAGTKVFIKPWPDSPCPVATLKHYLLVRPRTSQDCPLLVLQDGKPLSGQKFRGMLKKRCKEVGCIGSYNAHSLRIGAASDASRKGLAGHVIQLMGRWRSLAFMTYVRPTGQDLANTLADTFTK